MPDALYWPLFITFVAATVASIYKMVEANHSKRVSDDECTNLRNRLDELTPSGAQRKKLGAFENGAALAEADILFRVLALIAELHSQEIPATPVRLAADLGLDAEILLAHMWKFHNEQYITFRNEGKRPEPNTSFLLSPKAWQCIKVIKA